MRRELVFGLALVVVAVGGQLLGARPVLADSGHTVVCNWNRNLAGTTVQVSCIVDWTPTEPYWSNVTITDPGAWTEAGASGVVSGWRNGTSVGTITVASDGHSGSDSTPTQVASGDGYPAAPTPPTTTTTTAAPTTTTTAAPTTTTTVPPTTTTTLPPTTTTTVPPTPGDPVTSEEFGAFRSDMTFALGLALFMGTARFVQTMGAKK